MGLVALWPLPDGAGVEYQPSTPALPICAAGSVPWPCNHQPPRGVALNASGAKTQKDARIVRPIFWGENRIFFCLSTCRIARNVYNVNSGVLAGKHLLPFFRLSTEDGTPQLFTSPKEAALLPGRFPFASNLGEVLHAHTNLAGLCVCPVLHRCNLESSTAFALVWSSRSCWAGVLGSLRVAGRPPADLEIRSSYSRSMHRWQMSEWEMRAIFRPQAHTRCSG